MRLLIMGPQGVGKGTQAALLAEHFNIPTISTGDIFRYNIKNKTELGLEAMSYTDKGELVPDSLTNKIVKDRLPRKTARTAGSSTATRVTPPRSPLSTRCSPTSTLRSTTWWPSKPPATCCWSV